MSACRQMSAQRNWTNHAHLIEYSFPTNFTIFSVRLQLFWGMKLTDAKIQYWWVNRWNEGPNVFLSFFSQDNWVTYDARLWTEYVIK